MCELDVGDEMSEFQKHLVIWFLCKECGVTGVAQRKGVSPSRLSVRLVSVAFTWRNASTSMSSSGISALGWLWKWICSWQRWREHPWLARTLRQTRWFPANSCKLHEDNILDWTREACIFFGLQLYVTSLYNVSAIHLIASVNDFVFVTNSFTAIDKHNWSLYLLLH